MKRITIGLLITAMLIGMTSCNLVKSDETTESSGKNLIIRESDTDDIETDEDDTDVDTTAETTSQYGYKSGDYKLASWSIEPTVISDKKDIMIRAEELVESFSGKAVGIVIYVGNDSYDEISVSCSSLYINNLLWYYDTDEILNLKSGEDGSEVIYFDMNELGDFNIDEICNISISIDVTNSHGYKSIETDIVEIPTSAYENLKDPYPVNGKLIADNENVLAAYYTDLADIDNGIYAIGVYAMNRTDTTMNFDGVDAIVDGVLIDAYMRVEVPAGKSQYMYFNLNTVSEVAELTSKNPNCEISMIFGYRLSNTLEMDWQSQRMLIDFN